MCDDPNGFDRFWRLIATLVLAISFILPVIFMSQKSATFDEVSHLPAGYAYLTERAIRYNPQHPPLIKEIAALPLLFLDLHYPEKPPDNEWIFGREFLFGQDAQKILFWGRIPVVVLSTVTALLVMFWATKLWGKTGGVLALCLYALDPTITAHSQLVTTDVGVACFSVLYLSCLRNYLQKPDWKRLLFSGLALGLALGSKFSAVILIPATLLLLWIATFHSASAENGAIGSSSRRIDSAKSWENWRSVGRYLPAFGVMMGLAAVFLWAIYFFPRDPLFYWKGIQAVNRDRTATAHFYMMGMLKPGGWKFYLLIAWLVKTPIPFLLLFIFAVGAWLKGSRSTLLDEAFLIVPAVSYFVFYSLFADNLGIRYLIPCFPFLIIFTARTVVKLSGAGRLQKLLLALLLFWNVLEYAAIAPDHLSYFNQAAGGSDKGLEWLSDSNVDWGQGLIQLQRFIQDRGITDYAYFYFGTADPEYYGIRGRRITNFDFVIRPTRGLVVLSAHIIPRARSVLDRAFGNGPLNWLRHQAPVHIVGHAYYVYEIR